MIRSAIKFKDLDAFLAVVSEMGFDGEVEELIYEQDTLPYCSAYFVPTDLLPPTFDLTKLDRFGGRLTRIEEINYLGIEQFQRDFMIFPKSLTGYLEVDLTGEATFAGTTFFDDPEGRDMNIVINIEDGGGREFYLDQNGSLIGLDDPNGGEPQVFKTAKQAAKQMDSLRKKHADSCQVYALERHEFDARLRQIGISPPDKESDSR